MFFFTPWDGKFDKTVNYNTFYFTLLYIQSLKIWNSLLNFSNQSTMLLRFKSNDGTYFS